MIINETLGIQKIKDHNTRVTTRQAVRAIVFDKGKILMVHTNRGDYKFPGGGVKKNEELEAALRREVTEETGYIVKRVGDKVGHIIQRNINQFDTKGIFEMNSCYYFCTVEEQPTNQNLDKYEKEQEFKPVWIDLDEVIQNNEGVLARREEGINPWVYRETLALRRLKEWGFPKDLL